MWAGDDDHGGFKITNLANGVLATDAATVGQLASLSGNYAVLSGANIFTAVQTVNAAFNVNGTTTLSGVLQTRGTNATAVTASYTSSAATAGPVVDTRRASADAASGDLIGVFGFKGSTSTDTAGISSYAKIGGQIIDPLAAGPRGSMIFYTAQSLADVARFQMTKGLYSASASGGDMGEGTINVASGFYVNGTPITASAVTRFYNAYTANADLATTIPLGVSAPSATAGTALFSRNVTTTTATQRVRIRFMGFVGAGGNDQGVVQLLRGTTFLNAAVGAVNGGADVSPLVCEFEEVPGSAGTFAYSARVGGASGTVRMNGSTSAAYFGSTTTMVIEMWEP